MTAKTQSGELAEKVRHAAISLSDALHRYECEGANLPRYLDAAWMDLSVAIEESGNLSPFAVPQAAAVMPDNTGQPDRLIPAGTAPSPVGLPGEPARFDDSGYPIIKSILMRGEATARFVLASDYDALRTVAEQLERDLDAARACIRDADALTRKFIDKVESGGAFSKTTYAECVKFQADHKAALAHREPAGGEGK